MSVSCVTREVLQTSRIPTNDVIASTRETIIGGGAQTSLVAYSSVVQCATYTRSSALASSCDTSTLYSTRIIQATQQASYVVVTVTVSGYATFINTLRETICTTGPTPLTPPTITPATEPPTTTIPPTTTTPPSTTAPSLTDYSTTVPPLTTPTTSTTRRSPASSQSLQRSTVGPSDDLASLAAQDQPSASSASSNGVPIAPLVGGVVGGVGGALLLGLLLYFLLFRRSNKSKNYESNPLFGQAQVDPRHYEYTPVQVDQGYSGGMSEQGASQLGQYTAVDPFSDQENHYPTPQQGYSTSQSLAYDGVANELQTAQVQPTSLLNYVGAGAVTGGAFAAATQPQQGSLTAAGGSPYASSRSPSSLGTVSSTAPMVRQQQTQYRGLAEPSDSRF